MKNGGKYEMVYVRSRSAPFYLIISSTHMYNVHAEHCHIRRLPTSIREKPVTNSRAYSWRGHNIILTMCCSKNVGACIQLDEEKRTR